MGQIRELWLRWKMLRLPWRKKFFVGQDLVGNTFWEFRDPLASTKTRPVMRRIVHKSPYASRDAHHADIQISPQWHQWLRQTRNEAPSIQEQRTDVLRQQQLKVNARLADERWEAKARYIEPPKPAQQQSQQRSKRPKVDDNIQQTNSKPLPMTDGVLRGDVRMDAAQAELKGGAEEEQKPGMKSAVSDPWEQENQKQKAKQAGTNPGGEYQPQSWSPAGGKKR